MTDSARGLAERLAGLRGVIGVKPDVHLVVPVTQDGDRVAVGDSDNLAGPGVNLPKLVPSKSRGFLG